METSNKIYATVQGSQLLGCSISPYRYCAEYISKDALLEWARELKHVYELPISSSGKVGRISLAKAEVLQLIIDKINTL